MPTRVGRITRLGRTGEKFQEVYLNSGERVEIPHALMQHIAETYDGRESLIFVERRGRLFHFVQWAGTAAEARWARDRGILRPTEVPPDVVQARQSHVDVVQQPLMPPMLVVLMPPDPQEDASWQGTVAERIEAGGYRQGVDWRWLGEPRDSLGTGRNMTIKIDPGLDQDAVRDIAGLAQNLNFTNGSQVQWFLNELETFDENDWLAVLTAAWVVDEAGHTSLQVALQGPVANQPRGRPRNAFDDALKVAKLFTFSHWNEMARCALTVAGSRSMDDRLPVASADFEPLPPFETAIIDLRTLVHIGVAALACRPFMTAAEFETAWRPWESKLPVAQVPGLR